MFSKLDGVLANITWQEKYMSAEVNFQVEGEFDHSPALVTIYLRAVSGKKPFKYFIMCRKSDQSREFL